MRVKSGHEKGFENKRTLLELKGVPTLFFFSFPNEQHLRIYHPMWTFFLSLPSRAPASDLAHSRFLSLLDVSGLLILTACSQGGELGLPLRHQLLVFS